MKKRMLSMVMAVLMSCTLFVGCGSTSSGTKSEDTKKSVTEASDSTDDGELLASIKSKGKLTIGTASGYPPYEFVDAASGDQSVIGIDIELAQAIADKLGVKLEVQDMNFSSLLTSLSAGKVDMAIAGISPTDERKERINKLAKEFEMQEVLNNKIESYSHGMRQKIVIMSALLHQPQNLILDEPLTGLDPKSSFDLKKIMREYTKEKKTVFFSTHVLEVAERLCDRVGIIDNGNLVFVGTYNDLKNQFKEDLSLEELFMEITEKNDKK